MDIKVKYFANTKLNILHCTHMYTLKLYSRISCLCSAFYLCVCLWGGGYSTGLNFAIYSNLLLKFAGV